MNGALPPGTVLHFSLGPVQGFIADARRLRDYWAGSFLLSLLAGHAMAEVERAYAQVNGNDPVASPRAVSFPRLRGDELYDAIALGNSQASVYIGSLPNRFRAEVGGLPDTIAVQCRNEIETRWRGICDAVWKRYVAVAAPLGRDVREIWDRQTQNFWDITWAMGVPDPGDPDDHSWLDMRKNWRRMQPDIPFFAEGGDLCRLMGDFQELSGWDRGEVEQQSAFWRKIREELGGMGDGEDSTINLGPTERLSALAFIKRAFPILLDGDGIEGTIPWVPGGRGDGRKLSLRNWPSTSFIAALPWLRAAAEGAHPIGPSESTVFGDMLKSTAGSQARSETETRLFGFDHSNPVFTADGHLLHRTGIPAFVKERFADETLEKAEGRRKRMLEALETLAKQIGGGKSVHPSSFYAVLRMDGDGVGRMLGEHADIVRDGLFDFSRRVKLLFDPDGPEGNPHFGALVFAGGDDVLVILPVDEAINAALRLRQEYKQAFKAICGDNPDLTAKFTLSGAIIYSHFKNPLSEVLRQSADELDGVAKERNGRNSLALVVAKPGGVAARWCNVFAERATEDRVSTLQSLARGELESGQVDVSISGGLFHGLHHLFAQLYSGAVPDTLHGDDDALLRALVLAGLGRNSDGNTNQKIIAEKICDVIRPSHRIMGDGLLPKVQTAPGVCFEGGLIARFLAAEERIDLLKIKQQSAHEELSK